MKDIRSKEDQDKGGDGGKKRKRGEKQAQAQARQKRARRTSRDTEDEDEAEEGADDDHPALSTYISIIEQIPLYPLDFDPDETPLDDGAGGTIPIPHGPDGLRYHILDLWVDELEKVIPFENEGEEEEEDAPRKVRSGVPMELLLRPLERLHAESPYKPVRVRAAEALEDERLVGWGVREPKGGSEEEDEWNGFGDD